MCGITGIASRSQGCDVSLVEAMTATMHHRGPDGAGTWKSDDSSVIFGHRRLAIIDLSENGRQPMLDESAGVCVTFNGEIYNHQRLRKELVELGHRFTTTSDTEVILKAY